MTIAVRGPLRVNAPHHIGFNFFLNSAPSLWRGIGRNNVRGRRLRPRWPFPAIRGRTPSPAFIHLATVQAENKTTRLTTTLGQHVTHSLILTPSHLYNQSNRIKHVHRPQPASRRAKSGCTMPQAVQTGKHGLRSMATRQTPSHLTWQKKNQHRGAGVGKDMPHMSNTPRYLNNASATFSQVTPPRSQTLPLRQ